MKGLLLLLLTVACLPHGFSSMDSQDVAALQSLSKQWKNTPPNWGRSGDPCNWDGVNCTNSRVTTLKLFCMDIEGTLSDEIGSLTELEDLDLSYNPNLGGPLPTSIGNLKKLTVLRLIGCKFTGRIPDELGNLSNLGILSLNSNQFTGRIPSSLGRLSNLTWLDLGDNHLNGTLPTSANDGSGLDQLVNNLHFHLNLNNLSGTIPSDFFKPNMKVIHIILDHNQLSGEIPASVGVVQSLEVLRLDNNSLEGPVPSSINNLTALNVLNLAGNKLNGPMPNLTGMHALTYLDLSNNSFDSSEAPSWFSDIRNLTTLFIESGNLHGQVPQTLFSLPMLEEVKLLNNQFNGTLDMGSSVSTNLTMVNLQNNAITAVTISSHYTNDIMLEGNPVCNNEHLLSTGYCGQQRAPRLDLNISCLHPYEGPIICRAPSFSNASKYLVTLKSYISDRLNGFPVAPQVGDPSWDKNNYLQVQLKICPFNAKKYFNRSEILLWFDLSTQNLNLPEKYGPCYFSPQQYSFGHKVYTRLIIGIVVGATAALFIIIGLGSYALWQRRRARKTINLNNPFASWGSSGEQEGDAPHIKFARYFSLDELRKFTSGFSKDNEIGSGGYGKVYKGLLPDGQIVAIKRSQKGSMQGGLEFKTEIELLSRVHHKNLVELVGFCFEKGEKTLVYEYISNGTLADNLAGKQGIQLAWGKRLAIALDSARGLAYLHELAKPPIIHRDVKSSNILLDDDLTAKVADFGLSTLVADIEDDHVTTGVKGTLGYLDPEYFATQQLTTKSDVYSLGVVMLELIKGKPPIVKGKYIVREVKMAFDESDEELYGLESIIDPALMLNSGSLPGLGRFVDLAFQCVEESSENRPTMSDIVKEIENILNDNKMKYDSTSISSSTTRFGNARDASHFPYDELAFSSGVSSTVYSSSGVHSDVV